MADSNTETATPAAESPVQRGSEFSKPTGDGDQALWEKHFGGKDSKSEKPRGKSSESSGKTSDGAPAKPKSEKPEARETSKNSSATKSERAATSSEKSAKSAASTDTDKSSTPKESKSPKKDADSEATGQKTAEETDPEAPSKKARDLYEQAKKSEDRREARKLYKRAMVEAFGEVPPEFDDKRYSAVRTERAAREAAIQEKADKNDARFKEAVERLKPSIFVMRKLE